MKPSKFICVFAPAFKHSDPEARLESIASSTPSISLEAAIQAAEEALDGQYNNHPASIQYFVKEDGSVALTHVMQIRNEAVGTWYDAFIDAHSGVLLHVTDFVAHATVAYHRHDLQSRGLIRDVVPGSPYSEAIPHAGFRDAYRSSRYRGVTLWLAFNGLKYLWVSCPSSTWARRSITHLL